MIIFVEDNKKDSIDNPISDHLEKKIFEYGDISSQDIIRLQRAVVNSDNTIKIFVHLFYSTHPPIIPPQFTAEEYVQSRDEGPYKKYLDIIRNDIERSIEPLFFFSGQAFFAPQGRYKEEITEFLNEIRLRSDVILVETNDLNPRPKGVNPGIERIYYPWEHFIKFIRNDLHVRKIKLAGERLFWGKEGGKKALEGCLMDVFNKLSYPRQKGLPYFDRTRSLYSDLRVEITKGATFPVEF